MYELVRSQAGFQIVKGRKGREEQARPPIKAAKPPPASPIHRVDMNVWRNFVLSGKADSSCPGKPILESWRRCRRLGVDPSYGKCRDIRDTRELGNEFHHLNGLADETRNYIYELVRGKGLLVTISDSRGYLITMCGDYRALLSADRLNFGPGANWSEGSVGTNAIGTALVSGNAITVSGREHFCEDHHAWICSAAPIFDLYGQIMGCIDISGPMTANHHMALTLAVKGARAVESQFLKQQAADLQKQSTHLVSSAFNVVATGLMVLDANGVIQTINPAGAVLLNKEPQQAIGRRADLFFELQGALKHLAMAPEVHAANGICLKCRQNGSILATAYPIATPNGTLSSFLLVLKQIQGKKPSIPRPIPRDPNDPFAAIVGVSSAIQSAVETAKRVAQSPTTVLISGESGTGKEIMAKALHDAGPRAKGPFVAVNCGAIAHELIQSELFGYEGGAFTGARRSGNPGKFEQASGGTLFLDEIAEMPLNLQVNLLRVLEEGKVTRVGGARPIPVDVRIIAATNKDLNALVKQKAFRQDLYYRLHVVKIRLPPLRDRGRDLGLLAEYFIDLMSKKLSRPVVRVEPSFFHRLRCHDWPGNVRELKHAMEGAIALMPGDTLSEDCLCDDIGGGVKPISMETGEETYNLSAVEKSTILRAYARFNGNVTHMAKALGIGRNTLYAKMKKYGIM